MFSHNNSPFDEALSRPFVADEESTLKEKKPKFSWTSITSTVFSIDDDDVTYEAYEAPLVVVPLADEEYAPPERTPLTTTMLKYQVSMDVSELTHDLEQAVLQEQRHSDIDEICMDRKNKLHGIHDEMIADSKDYDINRMSWLAIEAFEETECSGLADLEMSHTTSMMMNMVGERKEKLVKTAVAIGFTVLTIAWALSKYCNGRAIHGESGDPQKFP
jgi:hypothetical protein